MDILERCKEDEFTFTACGGDYYLFTRNSERDREAREGGGSADGPGPAAPTWPTACGSTGKESIGGSRDGVGLLLLRCCGPVVAGVPPPSACVQWRLVPGEATMNDVEPLPKPCAAARVSIR